MSRQTKILFGSVPGGVLLITGSCVGAGMLALPVITGLGGFFPSVMLFLLSWLFMTTTAFLLLEVNLTLGVQLSLVSLAAKTLGEVGKFFCWALFLFLFYCLGIAYIAASGDILQGIAKDCIGMILPRWVGSLFFTLVFGIVIYLGARSVDLLNRYLMVGLIAGYALLIAVGSTYVKKEHLLTAEWKYAFAALPILVISFGFHNMIPSLVHYFHGDKRRLRLTVLVGSLLPLLIYLLWEFVMLGILPVSGRVGLFTALREGQAATSVLHNAVGCTLLDTAAEAFALFAIITSFLAQSLSLVDFWADALKVSKVRVMRLGLIALTLLPPLFFALMKPTIFIAALNMAGGFAAVTLFGIMPVLMIWIVKKPTSLWAKSGLLLVALFACTIFFLEVATELGYSLLPSTVEGVP